MKLIGILLVTLGVIVGGYAASMDTSLSAGGGVRVQNIALADNQLAILLIAAVAIVSGVVLYAAGEIAERLDHLVRFSRQNVDEEAALPVPFWYRYDPVMLGGVAVVVAAVSFGLVWLVSR